MGKVVKNKTRKYILLANVMVIICYMLLTKPRTNGKEMLRF